MYIATWPVTMAASDVKIDRKQAMMKKGERMPRIRLMIDSDDEAGGCACLVGPKAPRGVAPGVACVGLAYGGLSGVGIAGGLRMLPHSPQIVLVMPVPTGKIGMKNSVNHGRVAATA